jgi:HAMP domain-containing protein
MRFLAHLIPTRAAFLGAMGAFFAALFAWARRDARQDQIETIEKEDIEHAKDISDRVRTDRANPERVQPYANRGYRD